MSNKQPSKDSIGYDVLYQEWLAAKRAGVFKLADEIRKVFEKEHGLTIFAEGECVIEGVTVQPMRTSAYIRKYWDRTPDAYGKTVADYIDDWDSFVRTNHPDYTFMTGKPWEPKLQTNLEKVDSEQD